MSNSEARYSRAAGAPEVGPTEPHSRDPAAATAESGTRAPRRPQGKPGLPSLLQQGGGDQGSDT